LNIISTNFIKNKNISKPKYINKDDSMSFQLPRNVAKVKGVATLARQVGGRALVFW
jgi:hypothetical protein